MPVYTNSLRFLNEQEKENIFEQQKEYEGKIAKEQKGVRGQDKKKRKIRIKRTKETPANFVQELGESPLIKGVEEENGDDVSFSVEITENPQSTEEE